MFLLHYVLHITEVRLHLVLCSYYLRFFVNLKMTCGMFSYHPAKIQQATFEMHHDNAM